MSHVAQQSGVTNRRFVVSHIAQRSGVQNGTPLRSVPDYERLRTTTMTDATLVEQTLNGDKEAFGALVERYRHQVYALAFHHVRDFETAKDLAQEAFVQAFLKLAQLRDPSKFVAWLRALTTNVCRMYLRRREVETVPLDDEEAGWHGGAAPTDHAPLTTHAVELSALVRRAIDALPERQRLTVTMFYIDGLSYQDIAEFTGESVNAVESRLHRARAQLKERMMNVMSESFKPHHLPEEFTDEVLKKVRVMGVGMTGQQLGEVIKVTEAMGKDVALFMQDEQERQFPVRLTTAEAVYITMALEGRQPPRPMTHDLFKRIMETFDIKLEKVVLSDVHRGEFTARMLFRCGDEAHAVDARAGDAVAMAMRMGIEVFATPTTLKKARRLKSPVPPETQPAARVERREFPIFGERQGVMIYGTPTSPTEEERRKQEEEAQRLTRQQARRWARIAWEKQAAVSVQEVASDPRGNPVVVLADDKGWRLPIWIGIFEAQAIGRALKNGKVNVPLPPAPKSPTAEFPHDLIKSVLDAFGVKVLRMAVNALRESTFFGVVALQRNSAVRNVDARPSDGIALAVRCGCPLYVAREVMKEMSIAPDQPFPTPQVVSTPEATPIDILHLALRAVIEQNVERPRITLSPEGEQCRAVIKDKSGKVVWEQVGGSFAQCQDYVYNAARIDKGSPFPQKGAARCSFQGKHYELQVTVKDKPKLGRIELRLKPLSESSH